MYHFVLNELPALIGSEECKAKYINLEDMATGFFFPLSRHMLHHVQFALISSE